MKKLVILLFISFNYIAKSQIATIFADDFVDSSKISIGIIGGYNLNSNALTNSFMTKFYTGGYINSDLKNSVLSRMQNLNRVGGNYYSGVYGAFKLDSLCHSKNMSLFFSVRDRVHVDAQFSQDLFTVALYGNARYAGKTANFNDFSLNLMRYQQLQIGLFSSKLDSAARWGIGISFLKGSQYLSVAAPTAELYTSEDGQYIDFNTNMSVSKAGSVNNGLGTMNGYGTSIDVYFEAPFQTRVGDSKLRASVSDLGFIRFFKQEAVLKQDSLFHYTGFTINNIYGLQNSSLGNIPKDSVVSAIAPFKKKAFSVTLPAVLDLTFETHFNKHFYLIEGIKNVFNANYTLLYYVKSNIYINSKLMVSATFGYGGYGTLNYGLSIAAKMGKGMTIYLGSNNIEGYISPSTTLGQGVYFSLVKNFK